MSCSIIPYEVAESFLGIHEIAGPKANPWIVAFQSMMTGSSLSDEEAWCSSFGGGVCFISRVERSTKLNARSWLDVGIPISLEEARVGFDIVILSRDEAGPLAGHVEFFAGLYTGTVSGLGGNVSNKVGILSAPRSRVLGVRRLRRVA